MNDKKKTFVMPEAEVVILFDIETDQIVQSAGVNGWRGDDGTETWGQE